MRGVVVLADKPRGSRSFPATLTRVTLGSMCRDEPGKAEPHPRALGESRDAREEDRKEGSEDCQA
jgi:hypothetical protein